MVALLPYILKKMLLKQEIWAHLTMQISIASLLALRPQTPICFSLHFSLFLYSLFFFILYSMKIDFTTITYFSENPKIVLMVTEQTPSHLLNVWMWMYGAEGNEWSTIDILIKTPTWMKGNLYYSISFSKNLFFWK